VTRSLDKLGINQLKITHIPLNQRCIRKYKFAEYDCKYLSFVEDYLCCVLKEFMLKVLINTILLGINLLLQQCSSNQRCTHWAFKLILIVTIVFQNI